MGLNGMRGESVDIGKLVAEHHRAVYRYAYRLCGSVEEAEDLTQQVFLIAQQKLGQLRDPASALAWLFAILRRAFQDGRSRRRPMPLGDHELDVESIPAEPVTAADIDREQLQRALDALPEHHRLVLAMFYYEDLSYRQIGEKLAIPLGTVMSRLARAKAQLRRALFSPLVQRGAASKRG